MCRFCSQKGRVAFARAWGVEDRRLQLSAALTAPDLRALHRAEDIGSALKGSANVCQRHFVTEVLGSLVTEFVGNFGREGATPIQRGSNSSLLGRVQVVKVIKHNALRLSQSRPLGFIGRLLNAPGSNWCLANSSRRPMLSGPCKATEPFLPEKCLYRAFARPRPFEELNHRGALMRRARGATVVWMGGHRIARGFSWPRIGV